VGQEVAYLQEVGEEVVEESPVVALQLAGVLVALQLAGVLVALQLAGALVDLQPELAALQMDLPPVLLVARQVVEQHHHTPPI